MRRLTYTELEREREREEITYEERCYLLLLTAAKQRERLRTSGGPPGTPSRRGHESDLRLPRSSLAPVNPLSVTELATMVSLSDVVSVFLLLNMTDAVVRRVSGRAAVQKGCGLTVALLGAVYLSLSLSSHPWIIYYSEFTILYTNMNMHQR